MKLFKIKKFDYYYVFKNFSSNQNITALSDFL